MERSGKNPREIRTKVIWGEGALLRKSALQWYPVGVVQYAEADWGLQIDIAELSSAVVTVAAGVCSDRSDWGKDVLEGQKWCQSLCELSVQVINAGLPCAGQAWCLGRASGSTCQGSADVSGQTLASPVWLSLHWLLNKMRQDQSIRNTQELGVDKKLYVLYYFHTFD